MNSYTITIISVTEQGLPEGSGSGSLSFWIDPLPDSAGKAELAQLALHLDNDVFKLGEAPEQRPGFYYWPVSVSGVNLDWSQQDYVILRLRETSSGDSSPARVAEPLTAAFEGLPERHDGETAFTFRIVFSEAVSVTPDTREALSISLPPVPNCDADGAVCTPDRRALSIWAAAIVTGPADQPERNTAATGKPTISGTPQVGGTLTADTKGIADEDGLENAAFSYQWLANDADIPGATESTYTLSEAARGKAISVRVSFTDDAGNAELLTSEDTDAWSATMTVEWVYQGYGYYSTDAKKAGSLSPASFEVDSTTYTVKMVETQGWMYIGTDRELPFDFVLELDGERFASSDASFRTYSYGNIYKWIRTGLSWRDGDTVEVRLLRTFKDETAVNSAATGAPIISGTAQVGETLTADTSGIADHDGLTNTSFSYQWLADDTDIGGATGSTYTLADGDEGKTIAVEVSFTDDEGNEETLTSTATATVEAPPNNPATGAPAISGTAQVGETLTADTSGIADQDGLDNATFTFQWLADHADISGATGSTYTLADADEGKAIRVQISFTDDAGNEETLTSAATEAVAGNEEPVAREDSAAWSATMTVEWVYQGYGYYSTDAKKAGSLSPASFEVDSTTYTVKMVETRGGCTSAWTGSFPSNSCWSWTGCGSLPAMRPSRPTATATSIGGKERA